jgi:pimeloyl-ACP methyl ester carboxylesterase
MQTVIQDTLVNYSDKGRGQVLVCVHGWMHSLSSYAELTNDLQSNYRVIALDLPNFGASQVTEKIITIEQYANFVAAFVAKLKLENYTLVGHSMGCQINIYGVGNKILTPQKMILLSPAGIRSSHRAAKKTLKLVASLVKNFVPKSYKTKFYKMIGSDYNPDLSDVHKKIISKTLDTDVQAGASLVTIPTLIINGDADLQTPYWMAETFAREIKDAKLEIIPAGDHWVHQKSPKIIAGLIKGFVK